MRKKKKEKGERGRGDKRKMGERKRREIEGRERGDETGRGKRT